MATAVRNPVPHVTGANPAQKPGSPKRNPRPWTDEERDIIRQEYKGTAQSQEAIAKALGRGRYTVRNEIYRMGLARSTDRRKWTKEEDERLADLAHRYAPQTVARKMNRSVNSVVVRMKRLRLQRSQRDGWYTLRDAAAVLGKDPKWLKIRIETGALRARRHHRRTDRNQPEPSTWHIEQKDLRNFIRKYPRNSTAGTWT